MRSLALVMVMVAAACEGPIGPPGNPGPDGTAAIDALPGPPGGAPWLTSPGVALAITGLAFTGGRATVSFTLTDAKGTGLDRAGLFTDGAISVGFVLAQLAQNVDGSPAQYTAYTTRTQVTPDGLHSATQGAAESSGTFAVVDLARGAYSYTFAADLGSYDAQRTQTVAGNATRTMIDGSRYLDAVDFSVGVTDTPVTRQVVILEACNACHGSLTAHGGHWKATTQCVLCHQPQSSDPDTGNTVDFGVMIHKIHRGADLPSVELGGTYHIVGNGQSDHDFSTVGFPQPINRCESCHAATAPQGDYWKRTQTIAACTSCHDTTVFTLAEVVPGKTVLHGGLAQVEGTCGTCHRAGSIHPVEQRHHTGTLDPTAAQISVTIDGISATAPGQSPRLAFTVTNRSAGMNVATTPLTTLTATFAGPNTDYTTEWAWKIQGGTGTLTTLDAAAGKFAYQFAATQIIPLAATGAFTVGIEANLTDSASVRHATVGPTLAFAVTGAASSPRREIVSTERCDGCHDDLRAHGGGRKGVAYCVLCHNATNTDAPAVPRTEAAGPIAAETIDFRHLIHAIHMGERLTRPYVVFGFPLPTAAAPGGSPHDFAHTQYPRDAAQCNACHVGTTYTLPVAATDAPSTSVAMSCSEPAGADANGYCDAPFWTTASTTLVPAEVSACTGCHDAPSTAAHAALNTTATGQTACATCHGAGRIEDVRIVHGL
jgi:OmcA/MtrC family decaheme c-type cytochrome